MSGEFGAAHDSCTAPAHAFCGTAGPRTSTSGPSGTPGTIATLRGIRDLMSLYWNKGRRQPAGAKLCVNRLARRTSGKAAKRPF